MLYAFNENKTSCVFEMEYSKSINIKTPNQSLIYVTVLRNGQFPFFLSCTFLKNKFEKMFQIQKFFN